MREPKHTPSEPCDCKPGYRYHCAVGMLPEAINALAAWFAQTFGDDGYMPLSRREGYAFSVNDALEQAGLDIRYLPKRRPGRGPFAFSPGPTMGLFSAEVDHGLLYERLVSLLSTALATRVLLDRHPAEEPFRSVYGHVERVEIALSEAFGYLMEHDPGSPLPAGPNTPADTPDNSPDGDDTQHTETGS